MGGAGRRRRRRAGPGQPGVHRLRPGRARIRARPTCPGTRWRRGLRGRACSRSSSAGTSRRARAADGNDLFSALCHIETDDGQRFSDDDVVNHMIFLLMAAHDTSTITLHDDDAPPRPAPGVAGAVPGRVGGPAAAPDLDEIDTLTSLDLVMKECLRLCRRSPGWRARRSRTPRCSATTSPPARRVSVGVHLTHHMPELLAGPGAVRPRAVRRRAPRGQGAPVRLGSRSAAACTSASACTSAPSR